MTGKHVGRPSRRHGQGQRGPIRKPTIPPIAGQSPQLFPKVTDEQKLAFWNTFLLALEAKPQEPKPIVGKSGLTHPTVAVGLDEARNRLLLISGDGDPRAAALAQADIQAAYPGISVLMARPVAVNLSKIADALVELFGKQDISTNDLKTLAVMKQPRKEVMERTLHEFFDNGVVPAFRALSYASLNLVSAWQDTIMQFSYLQFENVSPTTQPLSGGEHVPMIRLGRLIAVDPSETDRRLGLCTLPLFEFSPDEAELFYSGTEISRVTELLKTRQIYQYFFPSPDQLALGLTEKNSLKKETLVEYLKRTPQAGHPLGLNEILSTNVQVSDLIDVLKERGLCTEGEIGIELTEKGRVIRATVRFKPREGVIAKISRVFSVKIDMSLKDFFPGSHP
jgi:hypothetical protein